MKNSFGSNLTVTLFGESHGPAVGAVLDGLCPGLPVDEAAIAAQLAKRSPQTEADTARREPDRFEIISGVFEGHTTGTPLCLLIRNEEARSGDYTYGPARPSHADYPAFIKYHGFEDYRGGGHFSGRVTAAIAAAGGILLPALEKKGIRIGTHILRCAGTEDEPFAENAAALTAQLDQLNAKSFPVLNDAAGKAMTAQILAAREEKDSVGGITETVISGLPAGLGEPWFDSVEGLLAHAVYSLGGVKGVEFGLGFGFAAEKGSRANDPYRLDGAGNIVTESNHNGGILGGITTGMPVLFRCAVKPPSSIAQPQNTVDFLRGEETVLTLSGRHDPTILRRICPVLDSLAALVSADLLTGRFGCDWFIKE